MSAKSHKTALPVESKESKLKELAKLRSTIALLPSVNAAAVVSAYSTKANGELDFTTLVQDLRVQFGQVHGGNLQRAEAMLTAQAHGLDAILCALLAQRAARAENLPQLEVNLRLALKAQSQSRATWETLATIRNPLAIFAKQANFSNGHQQINNGTPETVASVRNEIRPNELLEHEHDKRLDTFTPSAAIQADPVLATVGIVHRAKLATGQAEGR